MLRPANLFDRHFRGTLRDINRFRREGGAIAAEHDDTVGTLFTRLGYSPGFLEDYLLPMTGAIWSARTEDIADFPAAPMLRFLANHGLIDIVGRPTWRTVTGGSRNYVARLVAPFVSRIRLASPVSSVRRSGRDVSVTTPRGTEVFDHVVFATHSDQALRILGEAATEAEATHLSAVPYASNRAVLHSDASLMPRRRSVWSSWNAMTSADDPAGQPVSVTYWMNRLQGIDPSIPLFVTLNPHRPPNPDRVHASFTYAHPQFDGRSPAAQRGIAEIQGRDNTWFTGAYLGYGFHEDGLQSGLNVAAALGSPAPWHGTFGPVSSAPSATTTVRS
jgi:predicted NAD/FAD-binding protein